MRDNLKQRIKDVYKSGRVYDRDETVLYGEAYIEKIASVINNLAAENTMRFDGNAAFPSDAAHRLTFTEQAHPSSNSWIFAYDNISKLKWIEGYERPYPILWVQVSRVFPAWLHYYNLWKPRGNTGYLDAEIVYAPISFEWEKFFRLLEKEFEQVGIQKLNDEEMQQEIDFVFDEEYTDEEGNDLPDEQPPRLITLNVAGCLFPH